METVSNTKDSKSTYSFTLLTGFAEFGIILVMKCVKDDYRAKYQLWINEPPAFSPPTPLNLPHFGCKRFRNYAEMNAWKRQYRLEIARAGGVQWKH